MVPPGGARSLRGDSKAESNLIILLEKFARRGQSERAKPPDRLNRFLQSAIQRLDFELETKTR
jgi:hypothetical protein